MNIKRISYQLLLKNRLGKVLVRKVRNMLFTSSAAYWENRYKQNGNSGKGSYGKNAEYKAAFLNHFVLEKGIFKVIEFGCGDGNQLRHFTFPSYVGLDISTTTIAKCKAIFKDDHTKSFFIFEANTLIEHIKNYNADLALSLDVIFHLVEDDVFEVYMSQLFSAASKYVIIYAWDVEGKQTFHVRHRKFSKWITCNKKDWRLEKKIKNNEAPTCDFFIYEKIDNVIN